MSNKKLFVIAGAVAVTISAAPLESLACAHDCGVFDVSTSSKLPTSQGGRIFLEESYINQDKNWHASSSAPEANNDDKVIRTHFFTVGTQYMFNRSWGAEIDVPFVKRRVTSVDEDSGDIVTNGHTGIGDIRVKGIYSGFSENMSTGLTFGLKLPTGSYKEGGFERDTQIGTGSTDLLLGAYHMGNITASWKWFVNGRMSLPILDSGDYRPGSEINVGGGVYYEGWRVGDVRVSPLAQISNSYRFHNTGIQSMPDNSGYEQLIFSPGVEVDYRQLKLNANVGLPLYRRVNGNQLVSDNLLQISISHSF